MATSIKFSRRSGLLALLGAVAVLAFFQYSANSRSVAEDDSTKQVSWQPTLNQELPADAFQLYSAAGRFYAGGEDQKAFDAAAELVKKFPENYRGHLLKGEIAFALGDMKESVSAFDEVIRVEPNLEPSLWQRGLALYYLEAFEKGVDQFETHQRVNSQDVENAVWHLLCAAKVEGLEKAREKMIPIERDSRVPMSEVHRMFSGNLSPEDVLKRAKETSLYVREGSDRQKLQLYYAHLYNGLFYEMTKQPEKSMASMKNAAEINPLGKNNLMGRVADVHLKLRTKQNDQGINEKEGEAKEGEGKK